MPAFVICIKASAFPPTSPISGMVLVENDNMDFIVVSSFFDMLYLRTWLNIQQHVV
jgi:hypothetical protein